MALLTFSEALTAAAGSKAPHLLLGNGFSIACRPQIFAYGRLYERADFSKISPTAKYAFEALETQDFEKAVKALRDASKILAAYRGESSLNDSLRGDADGLRELLVQTIAASHPSWPGELTESEFGACRQFLSNFKTIYTLNYDLLLYWALMHTAESESPASDDGFRTSDVDPDSSYVVWEPDKSQTQNTWFLHGALHLFDCGPELRKYTWKKTGVRLIDQIRDALGKGYFPLFVSEGTSAEKYDRIRHNDYLAKAYRSFGAIQGTLFIFGHSLAENDDHILRAIRRGKLSDLYVGIHGDPDSDSNRLIMRRANELSERRANRGFLTVSWFDASTAKVWEG